MNRFVFALCSVSIIGMICRSLVAKPSYRRIINIIIALAAMLAAVGSFPEFNETGEADFTAEERLPVLDEVITQRYIKETEKAVASELERLAEEEGYSLKVISIFCSVNEYDTIVIDRVEISAAEQTDEAREYLQKLLPDTEITADTVKEDKPDG